VSTGNGQRPDATQAVAPFVGEGRAGMLWIRPGPGFTFQGARGTQPPERDWARAVVRYYDLHFSNKRPW
jgi:hypothetical protein